uniref:Interferon induced protein 2 n=1 Tax=Callorhinchus milii TaxID=7868 RepID=K4FSL6_CALMI|nr:interferon induced protein 2 [Callorhinchus milii]
MQNSQMQVSSYLGWSIFNLLCCCFPLGIAAVIYSCQAQSSANMGSMENARSASETAKKLNIAATVIGIIILVIVIILYAVLIAHIK